MINSLIYYNMQNVIASQQMETKLLSIGRMWDNSATAIGNQPKMRIILDRNLGLNITLSPGSRLVVFQNSFKREGKKDPDFRIAVELPRDIADAEISRQKNTRNEISVMAS